MFSFDLIYLLGVTLLHCASYFVFYKYFFYFFKKSSPPPLELRSLISILHILILSLSVYVISYAVQDVEISNRIVHAFGGGFVGFMVCYLAVKDSRLPINRFQFFVFSFLVVAAFGIFNEIVEFVNQNYFSLIHATSINDTWLDLISNTIGTLLAAVCFTPFLKK